MTTLEVVLACVACLVANVYILGRLHAFEGDRYDDGRQLLLLPAIAIAPVFLAVAIGYTVVSRVSRRVYGLGMKHSEKRALKVL